MTVDKQYKVYDSLVGCGIPPGVAREVVALAVHHIRSREDQARATMRNWDPRVDGPPRADRPAQAGSS